MPPKIASLNLVEKVVVHCSSPFPQPTPPADLLKWFALTPLYDGRLQLGILWFDSNLQGTWWHQMRYADGLSTLLRSYQSLHRYDVDLQSVFVGVGLDVLLGSRTDITKSGRYWRLAPTSLPRMRCTASGHTLGTLLLKEDLGAIHRPYKQRIGGIVLQIYGLSTHPARCR